MVVLLSVNAKERSAAWLELRLLCPPVDRILPVQGVDVVFRLAVVDELGRVGVVDELLDVGVAVLVLVAGIVRGVLSLGAEQTPSVKLLEASRGDDLLT